jgi:hypothetical protein
VAVLNAQQRARRRQVEAVIRLMAPALDAILFAGEQLARATGGRDEIAPPPRRRAMRTQQRSRIGGPPA